MFFKDFVSVKRQKIKRGASQTYDTPPFLFRKVQTMQTAIYNKEEKSQHVAQIVAICLGTRCPPREQRLLVSCSPVPHHVVPEESLEGHGSLQNTLHLQN